tara:strand:+ start:6297 stop:6491 length:195 start_codon:yes stop_codon:yes gene_type:complete
MCCKSSIEKAGILFMHPNQNDERERFIDENLRRVYDETVEEGIPDKFKDLLNQLKEQDKKIGRN